MHFFEPKTPARIIHAKVFFITLCILFFSSQSVVDQSYAVESKEDVKQLMVRGLDAAKRNDWSSAIEQFEAAREIEKYSPLVLFNLALAHDKAGGRELIAIPWYQAYLVAERDPEKKRNVQQRIEVLDARVRSDIRALMKKAHEIGELWTSPDSYYQHRKFFGRLADAAANMGYFSEAWSSLSKIDLGSLNTNLEHLAKRLVAAGDFAAARRALNWIDGTHRMDQISRDSILFTLAKGEARRGDIDAALSTFGRLEIIDHSDLFYAFVTSQLIKFNDLERATTMAARISNDNYRQGTLFSEIIEAKIAKEDLSGIMAIAERLPSNRADRVYEKIAKAFTKTGDYRSAQSAAGRITNYMKDYAYYLVFQAQAKAGDIAAARATMAQLSDQYKKAARSHLTMAQADAQAKLGDVDAVIKTTELLGDEPWAIRVRYRTLATAQANAGDITAAKATIEKLRVAGEELEDVQEKIGFYCQLARQFADLKDLNTARGYIAQAKQLAATRSEPKDRAYGFRAVALTQFKIGDPRGARESMAAALDSLVRYKGSNPAGKFEIMAEAQREIGDVSGAWQSEAMASRIRDLRRRIPYSIVLYTPPGSLFDSETDLQQFMGRGILHSDRLLSYLSELSTAQAALALSALLVMRTKHYVELQGELRRME